MLGRFVFRAFGFAVALWLLASGCREWLLLAAGETHSARVQYAVSSWGARNRSYTIYYAFEKDGREWRGSGDASRALPAGSAVRVLYWNLYPGINAVDAVGALILWGVVHTLSGCLIAGGGLWLWRRPRGSLRH